MTQDPKIKRFIKGCVKGDQTSQLHLYQHFYSYGMGVCLPYTKTRQEALEVLNDGFLKVFKKIDRYNPEFPFKPWLRRILINASIDYYRKYYKHQEEQASYNFKGNSSTHNLALENLAYEDLIKIMQTLPPSYRMVFNLFVIEGLPHKEIAEKLGIGEGTSKSNLLKARSKIQVMLERSHDIYFKSKKDG